MGRKRWIETEYDKSRALELARECETDVFATLLMQSRGIDTPEKIEAFLDAENTPFSSPFLLADMDIAVARITAALEADEEILVYGDYDCDGVTATAVLYGYLSSVGASVRCFIPSRLEDGYGLSPETAQKIISSGVKLVITVDNGISSVEEAKLLKNAGIDLIVTDHHTPGDELPDCTAVINPHRADDLSPEKNFAGCGVAFKLISALEGGDFDMIADEFLDIVALGTVADIVPLTGENRTIVTRGLKLLCESSRPGIVRLLAECGAGEKELSSSDIAYILAPKINSVGRMADACLALDLLLCESEEDAAPLVEKMKEANALRQKTENEILAAIEQSFDREPQRRKDKVIVAWGQGFHPGVIGIVAARLMEKYSRPAFVITLDESGVARGSARGPAGFHLYEALSAVKDVLTRFGGHRQAAGFALETKNLSLFREKINEYALSTEDIFPTLTVDCRLNAEKMSPGILDSVALLAPFGQNNPEPVFGLYNMRLAAVRPLKENKHLRLTLTTASASVSALVFGTGTDGFPYTAGDMVDVAFTAEKNEYRGEVTLSLIVKDIRASGVNEDGLFSSLSAYYDFRRGKRDDVTLEKLRPDRLFVTSVYRFLRDNGAFAFSPEILCMKTGVDASNAGRAQICLDALTELKLLTFDGAKYTVNPAAAKTDLTDSVILQKVGYKQ